MSSNSKLLQEKLDTFLRIAKNNEQKQRNFQEYELSLLNSSDLYDLISLILEGHLTRFQLTDVTLLFIDPEYEFRRLLSSPQPESWQGRLLFVDNENELQTQYNLKNKPLLATYTPQYSSLFSTHEPLGSIALLPLIRQKKHIGCLNLGSKQSSRFQSNIGTQFLQHLSAVISACIENTRLQENIKQLGLRDPLTNINNRRFFDQRIQEEVSLALRNKTALSCLFIDLDYFKRINDLYGHQAGDDILSAVARIFNSIMRTTDVLARYGGEEFVILLANTPIPVANEIADRIRDTVASTRFTISAPEPVNITLSIGLATLNQYSLFTTAQQLINAADQAMYSAKELGRNRICHA